MEDGRLKWFDCIIVAAAQSRFNFPFFTTIISGHWLLMITGRLLMEDGGLKWFDCIIVAATQSKFNSSFFNCIQSGMVIMYA